MISCVPWRPVIEHPDWKRRHMPRAGDLIAIDHHDYRAHPWRVVEVRQAVDGRTVLVVRDLALPDFAGSNTLHLAVRDTAAIHVLPQRYAVCSCCGDLMPCSRELEDQTVAAIAQREVKSRVVV